jgi:DNA-binding transcriptional ArsR family regulator
MNNQRKTYITKLIGEEILAKDILLFDSPKKINAILNPLSWKILTSLSKTPKYPAQLARELNLYRQKVYYHTRKLEDAGFIKASKVMDIQGGLAKYYTISYPAFGIELPFGDKKIQTFKRMDTKLESFCSPIIESGNFNGHIVVGSPEPHGPNKTTARDGHYAVQLAFFLGQFCKSPPDFVVKLDVDIKTEKGEDNNMILIGGPGTNILTDDINDVLPIHFNKKNFWAGLSNNEGKIYSYDSDGIIAKIPNPYDSSKRIIVIAGNRYIGTKSAVIAFSKLWSVLLKDYHGEDSWAVAVRGFDMDGDGKIDSAEVLS